MLWDTCLLLQPSGRLAGLPCLCVVPVCGDPYFAHDTHSLDMTHSCFTLPCRHDTRDGGLLLLASDTFADQVAGCCLWRLLLGRFQAVAHADEGLLGNLTHLLPLP